MGIKRKHLYGLEQIIAELKSSLSSTHSLFEVFYSLSSVTPPGAAPLDGRILVNCKETYPDFWKKCIELSQTGQIRAITQIKFDEEINSTGSCGGFVIYNDKQNDSKNYGNVRLPLLDKIFLEPGIKLGHVLSAGLPNITGSIVKRDRNPNETDDSLGCVETFGEAQKINMRHKVNGKKTSFDTPSVNNALVPQWSKQYPLAEPRDSNGNVVHDLEDNLSGIEFDASRANSIYGKSDTVQPKALGVCAYIQLCTAAISASLVDFTTLQSAINQLQIDKLDTSHETESSDTVHYGQLAASSPLVIRCRDINTSNILVTTGSKSSTKTYRYQVEIPDDNNLVSICLLVARNSSGFVGWTPVIVKTNMGGFSLKDITNGTTNTVTTRYPAVGYVAPNNTIMYYANLPTLNTAPYTSTNVPVVMYSLNGDSTSLDDNWISWLCKQLYSSVYTAHKAVYDQYNRQIDKTYATKQHKHSSSEIDISEFAVDGYGSIDLVGRSNVQTMIQNHEKRLLQAESNNGLCGKTSVVLYVSDKYGNDITGTGAFENPFKTVNRAVSELNTLRLIKACHMLILLDQDDVFYVLPRIQIKLSPTPGDTIDFNSLDDAYDFLVTNHYRSKNQNAYTFKNRADVISRLIARINESNTTAITFCEYKNGKEEIVDLTTAINEHKNISVNWMLTHPDCTIASGAQITLRTSPYRRNVVDWRKIQEKATTNNQFPVIDNEGDHRAKVIMLYDRNYKNMWHWVIASRCNAVLGDIFVQMDNHAHNVQGGILVWGSSGYLTIGGKIDIHTPALTGIGVVNGGQLVLEENYPANITIHGNGATNFGIYTDGGVVTIHSGHFVIKDCAIGVMAGQHSIVKFVIAGRGDGGRTSTYIEFVNISTTCCSADGFGTINTVYPARTYNKESDCYTYVGELGQSGGAVVPDVKTKFENPPYSGTIYSKYCIFGEDNTFEGTNPDITISKNDANIYKPDTKCCKVIELKNCSGRYVDYNENHNSLIY